MDRSVGTTTGTVRCVDDAVPLLIVGYPQRLRSDHDVLLDAAARAGIGARIVDPSSITITGPAAPVRVDGRPVLPRAVLPRGLNRAWPYLSVAMHSWYAQGSAVIPLPAAASRCIDKWTTTAALMTAGIAVLPSLGVLPGPEVCTAEELDIHWSGPVIVKPARGSKARGVEHYDDLSAALTAVRAERPLVDDSVDHQIVQPLATGAGTDHRVIVARPLADAPPQVIAVTRRRAPSGTFITTASGAANDDIDPNDVPEIVALARAAAETLELDFCGIDIIDHHGVPVILEVNAWPGLAPRQRGSSLADALIAVTIDRMARAKASCT